MDASPVGRALIQFAATRRTWTGTAAELLQALAGAVDESVLRSPAWPRSPRGLSGAVRRLAPALRLAGVMIDHDRATDAGRTRLVRLCYRPEQPSRPSRPSDIPPGSDGSDGSDGHSPQQHDDGVTL